MTDKDTISMMEKKAQTSRNFEPVVEANRSELALHAETQEKIKHYECLKRSFLLLFSRKEALLTTEKEQIECRYWNLIGNQKMALREMQLRCRKLKLQVQRAQSLLNRGETPDITEIRAYAQQRMRLEYRQYYEELRRGQAWENPGHVAISTVTETRELFRRIVRMVHPDLHPNQPKWRIDLMNMAKDAYATYDTAMLREIIAMIESDNEQHPEIAEDLDAKISKLERSIVTVKREISRIVSQAPFTLREKLDDPDWVAEQIATIGEQKKILTQQMRAYRERLTLMTI